MDPKPAYMVEASVPSYLPAYPSTSTPYYVPTYAIGVINVIMIHNDSALYLYT